MENNNASLNQSRCSLKSMSDQLSTEESLNCSGKLNFDLAKMADEIRNNGAKSHPDKSWACKEDLVKDTELLVTDQDGNTVDIDFKDCFGHSIELQNSSVRVSKDWIAKKSQEAGFMLKL